MRRLLLFLFGFAAMGVVLYAQARTPISNGSTLPAHCNVGDAFYKSTATAGLYMCSSTDVWTISGGGGSGTVTHTGTLTANHLIVGNGSADILILGSLGTTTTLLHGNAGGAPTFGSVNLAADITGNLGVSHLNSGTSASSSTFWRGDGTWATPTAGSGTVTSVAMTVPTFLSIAGSPVTTTGTLAVTLSGTALPFANGGTGLTSAADDTVMVSSGSAWVAQTVPNCIDTGGNHLNYTQSTNLFSCGTSGGGGGGSALSSITAATGTNTIASGTNSGQVWNWALTANTVTAFTFGETTAASNGTANGQAILGVNTLASSTAVPLYIQNLGNSASLRIDDVASDTTSFYVDSSGGVVINGACCAASWLDVHGNNGGFIQEWFDGTHTGGVYMGGAVGVSIGTVTNHDFGFFTNNGSIQAAFSTSGYLNLRRASAVSSISLANAYLTLGLAESGANDYWMMGLGYNNGTVQPAYIGFQEIVDTGDTYGDLIFGTRSVTSNTVPTERLRIVNDGGILIADLKTTGAAGTKKVVCVDTSTGKLYASSTTTDCSN